MTSATRHPPPDYNILLLQHLAAEASGGAPVHRLDLDELLPRWQAAMQTWRSWMCTQTRQTLQQVAQGYPHGELGGGSNAMSLRSAAAYGYFAEEEDVVHFAHTAMFTHREQTAHEGAEFFSRVAYRVMHRGLAPRAAIEEVASLSSSSAFVKTKVAQGLAKADEAMDASSALSGEEFVDDLAVTSMARLWDVGKTEPIKVGKASPTEGTLPASIYFIVKYAGDFAGAAIANTMVGGDNAARAVAIGMVMGAAQGVEGIPETLGKGHLVEWEASEALLEQLPLIKAAAAGKEEL
jgi:ADP-ribosylglycohydrolase